MKLRTWIITLLTCAGACLCGRAQGAGGLAVGGYNNNSGAAIAVNKVVVRTTGASATVKYIDTTTSANDETVVGVTRTAINNGATGYIVIAGQATIATSNAVAQGNCIYTTTTAGDCDDTGASATPGEGCFGFAITGKSAGAGTFEAMIYPGVLNELVSAIDLQFAFANGEEITGADGTPYFKVGDGADGVAIAAISSVPTIATFGASDLVIAPDGEDVTVKKTLTVTDGTDGLKISVDATNMKIETTGTSVLVIAPDGGDTDITGTCDISGAATVGGTLGVTGLLTLTDNIRINGGIIQNEDGETTITMEADQDVVLAAALAVTGGVTVGGTIFRSGNMVVDASGFSHLRAGTAQAMYFDAGENFRWRDVDGELAARMTLASDTGDLTVIGDGIFQGDDISSEGAALKLNDDAAQGVTLFGSATEGETPAFSISGYKTGDDNITTLTFAADTVTDDTFAISGTNLARLLFNVEAQLAEDTYFLFGIGTPNFGIKRNDTTDIFVFDTLAEASADPDYGMWTFAADIDNTGMTADQEVFEIGKGDVDDSGGNWVELFAVDEDGDLDIAGDIIAPTQIGDGTNETAFAADGFAIAAGTARWVHHLTVAGRIGALGPSAPTLTTYGIRRLYAFSDGENIYVEWILPADYVAGTDLKLGVQYAVEETQTDNAKTVIWNYWWEITSPNVGDVIGGGGTADVIPTDTANASNGVALKHYESEYDIISGTGLTYEDSIGILLERDDAGADTVVGDVILIGVDIKYISDRHGEDNALW